MKEQFIEFLKKEGAIKQFIRNRVNDREGNRRTLKYTLQIHPPERMMATSFIFSQTPEGLDYWKNLNNKWIRYCKSLKTETL